MVALVRAGVTATCSTADRPRYGHLEVDSNLPDARIALGGPDDNPFTAAVLAAADPSIAAEVKRQLAETGPARVFVPAAAALDAVWVPDADLRGVLDLPVLIVAGDGAVAEWWPTSTTPRSSSSRTSPSIAEMFESRTVALVNRGRARVRRRTRRHPARLADAVLHRLAVRDLDRPAAAQGPRRLQLPAAALEPHLRLRPGGRATVTGVPSGCPRAVRNSIIRWSCVPGRGGDGSLPADGLAAARSSRPGRCSSAR